MVTLLAKLEGSAKHKRAVFRCQCGQLFIALIENVQRGHTKSCGCFRKAKTAERSLTHGHKSGDKRSKVYLAWINMKGRCTNPKRSDYKNYGGRGITYDPSWESFENFLRDMGEPSDAQLTLDRKDNSKGYSKENCRWASRSMQGQNKRNCKYYTFNGKTQTLGEWAKATGIGRLTIWHRLKRGMPIEAALTVKPR